MAQSGKPWHICDDCLDPLAHDLFSIASRMPIAFDVAKADRMDAEYRQIQQQSAYCDDRLTVAQRKRRDELLEQMRAQTEPPRALDVDSLYRQYHIDLAIDWLKFNVSVEYADDFKRALIDAEKRFSALEFKACQIINGDEGKESTILVRYPIHRLMDRYDELLRESFPDHEYRPDREELPDDLRAFEVEILDEYTETEQQIREAGRYLGRVSAILRAKMRRSAGDAAHRDDAAEGTPAEPANEPSLSSPTGFLGGAALADAMGIYATRRGAFFRQLERQRMSLGDDCWHEVRDPRPNRPRFLYRVDSPKLRELATAYKAPKPA